MKTPSALAPELDVARWFNAGSDLSLASLRGKVVVLHAFQMLCPGCVSHGIPQAKKLFEFFDSGIVAVIGLHTVFEHHAAMTPVSLEAFLHEYRIEFPVAVDRHDPGVDEPRTMRAFGMQGTPSLVLIDQEGRIRAHHFGRVDDLALGLEIGQLLSEGATQAGDKNDQRANRGCCTGDLCASDC
jgi:peroxiredoxin